MFQNKYRAASAPRRPALGIAAAATDSGKGSAGSSTITRRTSDTNRTPSTPPTIINAVDFQYAGAVAKDSQEPAMRNAGSVKMAPAATDSPMEPAVRARFSSSTEAFQARSTAMPVTAAGYVAAIVRPARTPRWAA